MHKTDLISIIESLRANKSTLKELDLSCQPGQASCLAREEIEIVADYLVNNTKLVHLNLSGNAITDEDIEYLARKLYHNNSLKSLNLANAQITAHGLEALAALMFFNTQIVELNLEGIPALQDKQSARSLAIIQQALVNNGERLSETKIRRAA